MTENFVHGVAVDRVDQKSPTIVYVGGHKTVMDGNLKSTPIKDFCVKKGYSFVRFDYTGWGKSGNQKQEWDVETWALDLINIIDSINDKIILVGNSMGGYLMLAATLARSEKIIGLVGVAAGFGEYIQHTTKTGMFVKGEDIRLDFALENDAHIILNDLDIEQPIRLIHGVNDKLVPWRTVQNILDKVKSNDVVLHLVKNGDHSMSKPHNINYMLVVLDEFIQHVTRK